MSVWLHVFGRALLVTLVLCGGVAFGLWLTSINLFAMPQLLLVMGVVTFGVAVMIEMLTGGP